MRGKKFKKGLPKKTVFVFEDPKEENAFYNYVNTKFQLDDYYVDVSVPFMVDGNEYYFSFYEVDIPSKFVNLLPLLIDVALERSGGDPILDDAYESRNDSWYIAIEVFSVSEKDCLAENSPSKDVVLKYLRDLKNEYLNTHNYNEVLFKN